MISSLSIQRLLSSGPPLGESPSLNALAHIQALVTPSGSPWGLTSSHLTPSLPKNRQAATV